MLINSQKFASTSSLGSEGNTSFLRAARAGHLDKVLEHLKQNIDINTSNANGLNALHLASKDGHVQVVEELLKRGAAVDSATKKGNTALHIASLAGQEEVVKLLVNHGASVNVQSQNGFTPLYMAAQENHDNVVKYLLANNANQSLATEDGFTPLAVAMQQGHDKVVTVLLENDTRGKVRLPALHIAAKKDDVKAAKLLLENEHNPDVTSKSGFTPLHIASHYGNESIANLLIQKGADVNYTAKHNISPLHVAAKWGKTNMVSVLLDKGATIESKTRDGLTPLHCAARSGHEQVVDMLLERSAPISSKTKNGLAPLHMAAQGDHVDAARILLYHRAPVDEVTVDYLTALHVAAHCGHARVAKLLLDRGADANARALNGFTPLHIACKKNRIKVVELLLKHGASIGATTESGLTPLHVASFMGCMNIVIYLLQHEANPDVPTVRGETPLHLAARANQTDIIRILLRNGANVDARAREQQTPLHIASRLGNVDIVMLLLQHGAKVDTATKDMYTALHIAAKEGQDEVATALIDNGASLNATTKKGFTPLHLAAKYGNIKVAKLLLQKEAPVDAQGKNGVTPLHVASHYDHQNVALLLLDKGASPHATAKNGHTPLHIAAKKNQMDIANTLLEYGALPNAESKAGFTPLHLSSQEGHVDMTSLLIEHKGDPNYPAKNGLTPLHLCAQEDRVPVAEVLVQNGAEVDAKTKGGYTPLHTASHYGQANMVKFLLSHGTNVNSTTSIGYTPLHQAAQQGHTNIVNMLLENSAQPNAVTNNGQTPLSIAQKLGYISVIESLKVVTEPNVTTSPILSTDEKYRVVAPEAMQETFMSDSEEEGGEDTLLGDHAYRYLTADEMKSLGDDSLPIDVTKDERIDSNRMVTSGDSNIFPPQAIEDSVSPQHIQQNYVEYARKYTPDNVDISRHPISIGFLVSFLVDARGGAMRGCRHSGVRVIVPSRSAGSPTRITCRYVRPQRTPHPPPLMEGEALASRVLELGPVGVKFLGPVIIEVPHFAALRGKEREIVILRSDNGETWREHTIESSEDILNEVLHDSFEADDLSQMEDTASGRITRIVTNDFPQYFAVVSRVKQEVHAIGPEGGMVSSTVVPQVQAVFPQGALTKKIKVGLQAQLIDPELTAKLLGHGVAVSPVVTVEPRRRKFHKAITLSMPAPRAHSQGMINQYSGSAPTLRLLCSITGGTTRAQWEDVTGSTPLTFVNDCVSFTTTVSARFWLMDCRNIGDATKMATELYKEAIHVPFMAKFVVFAKRVDPLEARLRVFCMTDDKEDKTLEHQEHFTEVAKSRDVEVLEGKPQYIEFAGNLIPITKSGEQLQFSFRAFRENRLPFSVRVKDQHAEAVGRCLFMKEGKVPKGEPPQQPICILNIVLPDDIISETISLTDSESWKKSSYLKDEYDYYRPDPRLADMSNLLGEDWVPLANQLGLTTSEINVIKSEYPDSVAKQAQSMLRMWISQSGNRAQTNVLENALVRIGREDIIPQCLNVEPIEPFQKREDINRLTKEYFDRDKFIDGDDSSGRYKDKYSAEEKIVDEVSDEDENFKKTVSERRNLIEKRLSAERTIPASSQRVEIVQEISSIKRQSLVEDKIAEVEEKHRTYEPTQTITTKTTTTTPDGKIYTETIEQTKTTKPQDVQLSQFDIPEHSVVTTTTEVRTTKDISEPVQHIPDRLAERRDSDLLEGVTQRLETTKKSVPRISTESPYSPKLSKTPPPSPADFILRERAATVQEWNTSGKPEEPAFSGGFPAVAAVQDTGFGLTHTSAELTTTSETNLTSAIPKPKPRVTKSTDNDTLRSSQKSPVRDDILDTDLVVDPSIIEESKTYTDKKKFWESISGDSSVETQISPTKPLEIDIKSLKSIKETDISTPPPVPKPRSSIPASEGIEELPKPKVPSDSETSKRMESEIFLGSPTKIMSEYQAQFQDPSTIPENKPLSKISEPQFDSKDNLESEKGYISDSEDVEHYISDSEIEDRVPQIRTRQMSVFHPSIPARKSIYERSLSLPTEDLYDISSSLKRRKQYFEEQIKKELVEEQFATESEEEASPEHKTLRKLQMETQDETKKTQSVKDLAKTFDVTSKLKKVDSTSKSGTQTIVEEEVRSFSAIKTMFEAKQFSQTAECSTTEQKKMAEDYAEIFRMEQEEFKRDTHKPTATLTHKDELSEVRQSSTESEKSSSPERSSEVADGILSLSADALLKDESFSKPSDSMEVHIDKSEVEDSEKITDNEQDATDIETKSLDSLNAIDGSSRASFNTDEQIPEITVTLSGKQRRISEDSEDSIDEIPQIVKPISPIPEISSPICHPEENIDDTVWEVGLQSQPSFEKVAELPVHKEEKLEEDFSGSAQEESDLGSEIHQDHSDSITSDRPKSEGHSEIEQIILESLHFQNISPEEAKKIAAELISDIEVEIQKRQQSSEFQQPLVPSPEVARNQVSEYLRHLAETKGLDSREVELVESVLARKQRQFAKLKRDDTQASSMEITDEDLKFSGTEMDFSPSGSQAHILQQLEAEKTTIDIEGIFDAMKREYEDKSSTNYKTEEQRGSESIVSRHSTELVDGKIVDLKSTVQVNTEEDKRSARSAEESKTGSTKALHETELINTDSKIILKQTDEEVSDDHIVKAVSSTIVAEAKDKKIDKTMETNKLENLETVKSKTTIEDKSRISGLYESELKSHEMFDNKIVDTVSSEKQSTDNILKTETQKKIDNITKTKIEDDGSKVEITETKQEIRTKTSTSSIAINESHHTTETITETMQEILGSENIPKLLDSKEVIITKHEEVRRSLSDESKSSQDESAKSPEDQFSTCSSGRKGDSDTVSKTVEKQDVILRKTKAYKDPDTSSSSGNLKPDRKSGIEFEAYSSSGESHYHSFELDSKSRPCSSDIEGLMAANSSEYESALTSQDASGKSHISEYQTAASSLSSKESMKSLDSESSGNLASVEVSEMSETLVASELEFQGDEGDVWPDKPTRQSTQVSDSDLLSYPDNEGSMDVSEDDFIIEPKPVDDGPSRMKRSHEMTFQPEPKIFIPESPSDITQEGDSKFATSLDEGSILSMSLSSTSSVAAQRTIIEFSRADSEKLELSMNMSGTSEQLSLEDMENLPRGSRESLISSQNLQMDAPLTSSITAIDSFTSTHPPIPDLPLGSVTITSSTVDENGIQSVSTQVTSRPHTPTLQDELAQSFQKSMEQKEVEPKKKGHKRHESTSSFVPSKVLASSTTDKELENLLRSDLAESDKYTAELSFKEGKSDEKKDIDEREREESYETEADQGFHRDLRESLLSSTESDQVVKPSEKITETSQATSEPEHSVKTHIKKSKEEKVTYEKRDSHGRTSGSSSEKSSFEEAEAEAAFSMVAHVSPAHKVKQICPILEDEDAEKHELETRERVKKELEERRAAQIRDHSPGSIPDIKVTQHLTPLIDRGFRYPDLELEEQEAEMQDTTPETPASNSSKTSEETDQGKEYILDDGGVATIPEELEGSILEEKSDIALTESVATIVEKTIQPSESQTDSPDSDSFEMLEKPDLMDDFVIIEEVAKEAFEQDTEGKSVHISSKKKTVKKHDEDLENFIIKSTSPTTKLTEIKYYPEGSSGDELGFEFDDSPPITSQKNAGTTAKGSSSSSSSDYMNEYDKELEANKKWMEQQFHGDQAIMMAAGYGYEMEFERIPLEDIKEEEITDLDAISSRIGSMGSQKESGGSLGSVKDSFSSTPEYDVLAGRKYFTKSGEHDDISMSSLQEFENLERAMSLENRRYHQGSQDSSSNGSFGKRYNASRSGQGDDVSVSSLKEFEGLEKACIAAHKIEEIVKEEEALLTQIEEGQESIASESESCETMSGTDKKLIPDSDEEDYEKRMFEIDEIIRQAQSNVEKFIDIKDDDKPESIGRGDSLEEVSKIPDLDLDAPLRQNKSQWSTTDNTMVTSTDSLDFKPDKPSRRESTDSLDQKTVPTDIMSASTDSIEFQLQSKPKSAMQSDSIEFKDLPDYSYVMTSSDSLEMGSATGGNVAAFLSDSIDEDGSRIGIHDQSSSSTGKDFSSASGRDDQVDQYDMKEPLGLDPSDISSSTATHATCHYETDSIFSGSFTSGGSNTMVSSTDTIDPNGSHARESVDLSAAVRKVWFDDDAGEGAKSFTTEYIDSLSKPYVTEVIEPCEDEFYSHTIHRRIELPPEIRKVTFSGPHAEEQMRQYMDKFNEGEAVEESQEIDADGNVHTKKTVHKRIIVKSDEREPQLSKDWQNQGVMKSTYTDAQGTKTVYAQQFGLTKMEGQDSTVAAHSLLSSIAGDTAGEASGSWPPPITSRQSVPFRAQATRRRPLRYEISIDDQIEVDPREHDWRFELPSHGEHSPTEAQGATGEHRSQQREVSDQHQLSEEMRKLLEEMERDSKK